MVYKHLKKVSSMTLKDLAKIPMVFIITASITIHWISKAFQFIQALTKLIYNSSQITNWNIIKMI